MMDDNQVDALIERVVKSAHDSDPRCKYLCDWVEDTFTVNCYTSDACDSYLAEDRARRLALVVETILNQFYPRVCINERWSLSDTRCWDTNANALEVGDDGIVVVQYNITMVKE